METVPTHQQIINTQKAQLKQQLQGNIERVKKGKKRDVNTTEKEYTINMSSRAEGASKLNRSQEHWVTDGDQDHKQIQYLAT